MIRLRERLLDGIFGARDELVLNKLICRGAKANDISVEISKSLLALKQSAIIEENGVNYFGLRTSDVYKNFQQTTAACLRDFDLADLTTTEEKSSFWINLYNLLMIDAMLQFGVRKSVTEGWFGVVSFFRRAAYLIGGHRYSLEDIEHGILRANRGHPFFPGRHFSVNDPRLSHG